MTLNEEEYKTLKSHIVRKDSLLHIIIDNIYHSGMYFIDVKFLRTEHTNYRFFEIEKPLIGFRGMFGFIVRECKSNKEFILQEYDIDGDLHYYIKDDNMYSLMCVVSVKLINNWLDHCI